jgi:hypothetical protein
LTGVLEVNGHGCRLRRVTDRCGGRVAARSLTRSVAAPALVYL